MSDLGLSLRYRVGHWLNLVHHTVLGSRLFPLTRMVRPGRNWIYDIQRHAGARDFGVILDVGANSGQTAWLLVRYFRSSAIYAFEPVASSYRALQSVYGDRICCMQMALGREPARRQINLHSDSELNSFKETRESATRTGSELVEVTTVDQFCHEYGINKIGVLKIDVQGWEEEVLAGAFGMLSNRRIQYIYAEVGFRKRDYDMQGFASFNARMDELGYEFCGLYDTFRWGPAKLYAGFANALYARHDRSF